MPGQALANWPIRKNVARVSWRSSNSRRRDVTAGLGPSSKVSAIVSSDGRRRRTGPNSGEAGWQAPQANPPATAGIPASTGYHGEIIGKGAVPLFRQGPDK